jgi:hypothetical protein
MQRLHTFESSTDGVYRCIIIGTIHSLHHAMVTPSRNEAPPQNKLYRVGPNFVVAQGVPASVEMEIRQATVTVSVNGPPHDWDPRNCSWGPRTIYVLSLVNAYVNISWAQITFLGARIASAGQRRGHLHRAAHRPLALPARPRLRRGPVVRPPPSRIRFAASRPALDSVHK